ncbi:hypothetical protein BSKO_07264 [Bryopsis sp. KO-2023]|nr:hypothetical protein BSKO_07264 [Bryopsis sp. KO-2023]
MYAPLRPSISAFKEAKPTVERSGSSWHAAEVQHKLFPCWVQGIAKNWVSLEDGMLAEAGMSLRHNKRWFVKLSLAWVSQAMSFNTKAEVEVDWNFEEKTTRYVTKGRAQKFPLWHCDA